MVVKKSGQFGGKSNKLGFGGRAAQLSAAGVPGGVIGNLARSAGAAPGGPNFHGGANAPAPVAAGPSVDAGAAQPPKKAKRSAVLRSRSY